jgi:chemotaxis response regulator CheB
MSQTGESVPDMRMRRPNSGIHAATPSLRQPDVDNCNNGVAAKVIVIGGMDGDIAALQAVLSGLEGAPFAIVAAINLHQPFADRTIGSLQQATGYRIKIVETGDCMVPGQVLLVPSQKHVVFRGCRSSLACQLRDFTSECDDRHTIDLLFTSAAEVVGSKCIGLLFSGTGMRGVQGLSTMQQFRCLTAREVEFKASRRLPSGGTARQFWEAEQVPLAHMARWILEAAAEGPLDPPMQNRVR